MLIISRSCLVDILKSLMYKLSANRDNLTSPFSICIPIIFLCLTPLGSTSSTILKSSEKNAHPCTIPDFNKAALNSYSFTMMLLSLTLITQGMFQCQLGMANLPLSYWFGEYKRFPKQYRLLSMYLFAFRNLKVRHYD